jgi:glycosyltransferase involved in cell wall biosynthesis
MTYVSRRSQAPAGRRRRAPLPQLAAQRYPDVDVAIVTESTYPFLTGGLSAVVHDIVKGNQDLSFGIIHITWDRDSPHEDLYGMPDNVRWLRPVYLSMQEHRDDFTRLKPTSLRMGPRARTLLSHSIFDAVESIVAGDMEPMWSLYDDGINPRTRSYPLWAVLGSREFMTAVRERLNLDLPLANTFWLLREFFSLICAVLGDEMPRARVYHAHTTGYAALLGAAAARAHGKKFLLTEHNLYVRDTINTLLERNMALPVTALDWRTMDVSPIERAWMMWWIEMGRFCYPSAEAITYLYPKAILEGADLGTPVEKSIVIPNGIVVRDFYAVWQKRQQVIRRIVADDGRRTWRLVYIARVVPIKGLADLIQTIHQLVQRGITNIHLDILGPTEHDPDYYRLCREKARRLGVEDYLSFRGTVNVRAMLSDFDILVLSSYNEGQPIVALEAMAAGVPIVSTDVGGMAQLIDDELTTPGGRTWGRCGYLVPPISAGRTERLADALQALMNDPEAYARMAHNARGRVWSFFQLEDAMGAYNHLYRELGDLPVATLKDDTAPQRLIAAVPQRSGRSGGSHRMPRRSKGKS